MISKNLLIVGSMFLATACYNFEKPQNTRQGNANVAQQDDSKDNDVINLNGDKKWKIPDHMMTHINLIKEDIRNFEGRSEEDYALLSQNIDKNIDELTKECSMEGQAHEELHKWLAPFIKSTQELSSAQDIQHASHELRRLRTALEEFNFYFE
ncbi:hypothetical protein RCC89_10755 [Cytophagaceae bacterium ABcell3]|nr:hypothetical protein RCC89_10755 [Cytophagaceae bacterium ABcell3]